MKRVLFVVDGGGNIGLGHIVRCISLAEAFRNSEWDVTFLSGISEGVRFVENHGFRNIRPCWDGPVIDPARASSVEDVLRSDRFDIIVLDGYAVNKGYFDTIKKSGKQLLYIDDLNIIDYPVDFLVNGNAGADLAGYPVGKNATVYLLGVKYNLIRSLFANIPYRENHESVKDILVTTGGSDPLGHCLGMTQKVSEFISGTDIQVHVVIGNAFKSIEPFEKLKAKYPEIHLYESIDDIRSLMISVDIAISAGGGTLYELCACGVPTLTYAMVDNQAPVVEALKAMGCVKDFGNYDDEDSEPLINSLREILENLELRESLSRNGQNLVDGLGASRIVEVVEKTIKMD